MKRNCRLSRGFRLRLCICVSALALAIALLAADYSKEIKWNSGVAETFSIHLHFNQPGQSRSVDVQAQNGYKFKIDFGLKSPVPLPTDITHSDLTAAGLNSKTITFTWAGVDPATGAAPDHEVMVTLTNILVPAGVGGGGAPQEKPFDLTSLLAFIYCKFETTSGNPLTNLVMCANSTKSIVGKLVLGNGRVPEVASTLQLTVPATLGSVSPSAASAINGQGKVTFSVAAADPAAGQITLSNPVLKDESLPVNIQAVSTNLSMLVPMLEITKPTGDPALAGQANGDNERAYNTAQPGVLTVPCTAEHPGAGADPNNLRWTIENIGSIQATWNPSVSGGSVHRKRDIDHGDIQRPAGKEQRFRVEKDHADL
ncbi:MAG: hypothetical protein HY360_25310 [Verrucomicrobia bacterium]|nr:hypothetical protein [Verrucomicrobiota bacterium]